MITCSTFESQFLFSCKHPRLNKSFKYYPEKDVICLHTALVRNIQVIYFSDDEYYCLIAESDSSNGSLEIQSPEFTTGSYCLKFTYICPAKPGFLHLSATSEYGNNLILNLNSSKKTNSWEQKEVNIVEQDMFKVCYSVYGITLAALYKDIPSSTVVHVDKT